MEPVYGDEETADLVSKSPGAISRPASEYQFSKLQELLALYKEKLNEVKEIRPEEPCVPRAIGLSFQNFERAIGILEVAKFGPQDLDKVFTVFTYLLSESRLTREYILESVLHPLNFYSEGVPESAILNEGDAEMMIGKALGFLGDTFGNLAYINSLVVNLTHQLHHLYNKKQPKRRELYARYFKRSHLHTAFDALGSMLGAIAAVDAVVFDNENLTAHWDMYKRLMQFVKNAPEKYELTGMQERQLRKCLGYLDRTIMNSSCLEAALNQRSWDTTISTNKELQAEFQAYFRTKLDKVFAAIDSPYEWTESTQVIDCVCLYLLYRKLYPKDFDSKLFKAVWGLQKKAPAVVVTGQVLLFPSELLIKYAKPPKSVSVEPKDPNAHLVNFVHKSDEQLLAMMQSWNSRFSLWVTQMQNFLSNSPNFSSTQSGSLHENRGKLLLQGLLLARQVRNYIQLNTSLHQNRGIGFKKDFIPCVMKCLDLIKAIGSTLDRKQEVIALSLGSTMKVMLADVQRVFATVRERAARETAEIRTDVSAAFATITELSKGVLNTVRMDLLKLCADFVDMKKLLKDAERVALLDGLWKLDILVEYQENLKASTDCSFIYWVQELNTHFLKYIYEHPRHVHRLKYLYMALEDVVEHLDQCRHVEVSEIKEYYINERIAELDQHIVMPLARAVEGDLRLYVHALYIQGLERQNPLEISNISCLLESQPIIFCEKVIDIRRKVEHYLEETFYNMSALNLNDWQLYEEMSSMAKQKYNLLLSESRLPPQHLDQGMDLLEITKRLANFVGRFKYNLHSQFFIEATQPDNKNVACVTYLHIAKSLKTHGFGLVNTTINSSYKLLARRFQVFSQFLHDENIYSLLIKDKKFFEAHKEELNDMYPYDKADAINKEIRRMGLLEGGATYLDKFRQLITHIGNILGLIRMIKTGTLNQIASQTEFIPNTQAIPKFAEIEHNYSDTTKTALQTLDTIIESLSSNFTEDTNYFSLLVTTFQGVLIKAGAKHLNMFYMIIPALTVNFVESILLAKDKLTKKKAEDMYFTDDGFAMGLAYILRILEQETQFDSLHWFDSVHAKFDPELLKASRPEEMQKMQQISVKKMEVFREEFELFKYCFLGARIFFNQN